MEDYIDIKSLEVDMRESFAETIRGVIRRFGEQEFTQQHIVAVLINENYDFKGKRPKSCVSPNLAIFARNGKLDVIRQGDGGHPTVYRNKP